MTDDKVITAKDLTRTFGKFTAVDHITFDVKQGEIFGFLGANGAGKTTAIKMLTGILSSTSGVAKVAGFDINTERNELKKNIGYMSQKFSLYEDLTLKENIKFYGGIYGLGKDEIVRKTGEMIERLGLQNIEDTMIKEVPLGWKQKIAFSVAILHHPRIVFLDEPTSGVDPITRRQFWNLIYEAAADGITVFVTTHYMDEAELCQRVGFLSEGKLVALDTPDKLKQTQMRGHVLEIACRNSEQAVRILRQAQTGGKLPFDEIALYGAQIHAVVPDAERYKEPIWTLLTGHGIDVQAIEWIAPTLEDVFISSVQARGE